MNKLFKQKSLKVCAISIVVSGMALVGYNAYSNATMTPEERLFQQNLEALTSGEQGGYEYACFDACDNYSKNKPIFSGDNYTYRRFCGVNPYDPFTKCSHLWMKNPGFQSVCM